MPEVVSSTRGCETTFCAWSFVAAGAAVDQLKRECGFIGGGETVRVCGPDPWVVIVDDHPTFRHAARMLLAARGYDVVGEACCAASALDAVR